MAKLHWRARQRIEHEILSLAAQYSEGILLFTDVVTAREELLNRVQEYFSNQASGYIDHKEFRKVFNTEFEDQYQQYAEAMQCSGTDTQ